MGEARKPGGYCGRSQDIDVLFVCLAPAIPSHLQKKRLCIRGKTATGEPQHRARRQWEDFTNCTTHNFPRPLWVPACPSAIRPQQCPLLLHPLGALAGREDCADSVTGGRAGVRVGLRAGVRAGHGIRVGAGTRPVIRAGHKVGIGIVPRLRVRRFDRIRGAGRSRARDGFGAGIGGGAQRRARVRVKARAGAGAEAQA